MSTLKWVTRMSVGDLLLTADIFQVVQTNDFVCAKCGSLSPCSHDTTLPSGAVERLEDIHPEVIESYRLPCQDTVDVVAELFISRSAQVFNSYGFDISAATQLADYGYLPSTSGLNNNVCVRSVTVDPTDVRQWTWETVSGDLFAHRLALSEALLSDPAYTCEEDTQDDFVYKVSKDMWLQHGSHSRKLCCMDLFPEPGRISAPLLWHIYPSFIEDTKTPIHLLKSQARSYLKMLQESATSMITLQQVDEQSGLPLGQCLKTIAKHQQSKLYSSRWSSAERKRVLIELNSEHGDNQHDNHTSKQGRRLKAMACNLILSEHLGYERVLDALTR